MTDSEFEKLVAAGVEHLPEEVLKKLRNVAVVISDAPTGEQRAGQGIIEAKTLFGLYEGVPQTERGFGYFALPDKITIFKKAILETYSEPSDIQTCVANTVWHEIAHHFGMDEDEVSALEIKRGKTL